MLWWACVSHSTQNTDYSQHILLTLVIASKHLLAMFGAGVLAGIEGVFYE